MTTNNKTDVTGTCPLSRILVTGAAGFIGSNLVKRLFKDAEGATIIGIDNMNDYYDVALKEYRLNELNALSSSTGQDWHFIKGDIADKQTIDSIFETYQPQIVVNLAAQAGVRYSITNPDAYIMSRPVATTPLSIWSMPRRRVFMAAIRRCRSARMTAWTTQCRCMRPRRRVMSCSLTAIRNCMTFRRRDCASLRSMDLPDGLTWRISASPTNC